MSRMFYLQPAKTFGEALLCGNGRLGCTVYGGTAEERLVINEETLWSGKKRDRVNPAARVNLEKVRALIFEGKIAEAERLASSCLAGTPETQRRYKAMCDIAIKFSHGQMENYRRELDLSDAHVTVSYESDGVKYRREVFVSKPADCIVVKLTAEGGYLDCVVGGKAKGGFERVACTKSGALYYGGEGIKYVCAVRVASCDGKVTAAGGQITIAQAHQAVLLITAATNYKEKFPKIKVNRILRAAEDKSYKRLFEEHKADYSRLFDRVSLNFCDASRDGIPTDKRLAALVNGKRDAALLSLFFDFGRYLLISCSRKGGLPANLQGVWNEDFLPCWDSKYTININLQMNYWLADVCGLDECYSPFFDLLQRVRKSGLKTAKKMYACRGFVAHHNTDINADTAPQDKVSSATYWACGGAWLALHIYDHYLYTRDARFLKAHYPVLRDAALFFLDFLVSDGSGCLVTCPSLSPENSYYDADGNRVSLCAAPTCDNVLLRRLFSDFIAVSAMLKKDGKLAERASETVKKLPPYKIGSDGRLMEWREEYVECEKGHRHLSHLIGLYPLDEITAEHTPALAEAARRSLAVRLKSGGGYTGWSGAWIVNLFARLKDGENAYKYLLKFLSSSVFANLADNHPRPTGAVFQIDGNFGGTAAIAEMLLQSYRGSVYVLPALSKELDCGSFTGFRVRGGAAVDVSWKKGRATRIAITALSDTSFNLVYGEKSVAVNLKQGETAEYDGSLNII